MKKLESLKMEKFEVLNTGELGSVMGGAVSGRTRTVVRAQTAPECETCRHDSKKEVTVRRDD